MALTEPGLMFQQSQMTQTQGEGVSMVIVDGDERWTMSPVVVSLTRCMESALVALADGRIDEAEEILKSRLRHDWPSLDPCARAPVEAASEFIAIAREIPAPYLKESLLLPLRGAALCLRRARTQPEQRHLLRVLLSDLGLSPTRKAVPIEEPAMPAIPQE